MKTTLEKAIRQAPIPVVPYIMAGDGGLATLESTLHLLEQAGVAAIELGIPFSDPVADGPVIQAAGLRALQDHVSLEAILKVLESSKVTVPLVIMSYFNPILHLGVDKFVQLLLKTPVKGLIIPDLPYEHQELVTTYLIETDIALIPLVSLTSTKERIQTLVKDATGFVYAVTVNGTTGERQGFNPDLDQHLEFIKSISPVPVLAGFGISTIQQVQHFTEVCDGVIIGSKVVSMLHQQQQQELAAFLSKATNRH
ncbi:tryptophan synthase subunit alpha [Carnobacterium gallinarum]|uniref:tryptophan synthase subunit alpha n=1 Tax=Carnobacterium gallinarum TaxID=2749 RepID=UPI00054EA084|nr:tryptophan synthase subunit alpha [Carnobacterium gallinarum]